MDQSSNAAARWGVSDREFDAAQMSVSCFTSSLGSESPRSRAIGRNLIEAQAALGVACVPAGEGLPAADGDVDKSRLDFHRTGMASDPLGRHDRGAGAGEGVEDDIAPPRAVLDGVGHQRDRLGGWMRAKLLHAAGTEGIHSGVVPHVRARAPMAPERDIVEMWRLPDAKDADKLVLAAVERALASIRLHPHGDVDDVPIDSLGGCQQLANVPPIHAHEMNRTVTRNCCRSIQDGAEEAH